MYNVSISERAIHQIQVYISKYREYYQELFQDSGIWSEDKIIIGYLNEAENRYDEIKSLLGEKLSHSLPSYPNKIATIRWRTKVLLITFRETEDARIITDIDIR